jgi:hypothetical protein
MIQPAPSPPTPPVPQPGIQVGLGMTPDGTSLIVVMLPTVGGVMQWHVDPAVAEQVGAAMVQLGRQARTGLIVPGQPAAILAGLPSGTPGAG